MALRLHNVVEAGELLNTRRNSVHGWLKLRGHEQPAQIELTGNCDPDLAGWHFRFEARPRPEQGGWIGEDEEETAEPDLSKFGWHQIGPTGTMTAARRVKTFDCSTKEFLARTKLGEPPPTRWVRCLYLEWYSQNGRVVVELEDPILEFVKRVELPGVAMADTEPAETDTEPAQANPDDEDEDAPRGGLSVTSFHAKDDGTTEIRRQKWGIPGEDDEEEPKGGEFGVVPDELQRMLDQQAAETDRAIGADDGDSEIIREMELMDELIENDAGEPLCSLFEEPMQLPPADELDDHETESLLKQLLAQLALFNIAIHICEHYSPRDAYRLLIDKILYEECVFPQMCNTGWVTNIPMSEYCEQCQAELDRKFEEYERKRKEQAREDAQGNEDAAGPSFAE